MYFGLSHFGSMIEYISDETDAQNVIDYMSNEYVLIYFKYVNNYFKFQEG